MTEMINEQSAIIDVCMFFSDILFSEKTKITVITR